MTPGVLVSRVAGVGYLAIAIALFVGVGATGGGANAGLLVLALLLFFACIAVTAWDRRSLGRPAIWWTLAVLVFGAPGFALYTFRRRRHAGEGGHRAPVPVWVAALGFAFVAGVSSVAGVGVGSIKPYRTPSEGMAPTLKVGDRVITKEKRGYHPKRNEVVVFHPPIGASNDPQCAVPQTQYEMCSKATPTDDRVTFIKRVVAVPGDAVAFRHGRLVLNGAVQREPFTSACGAGEGCSYRPRIIIPMGHYFVLGDNRGSSQDSRFFGPVPGSSILGPVVWRYWPPSRVGSDALSG